MSGKMNRRKVAGDFNRKRRCGFDNDVAGDFFESKKRRDDVAVDFLERKHKRHENDVDDQLEDIIKLLKKILHELDEIEDELEDEEKEKKEEGRHHRKCRCHHNDNEEGGEQNKGHRRCKCHDDDDECECDSIVIAYDTDPTSYYFGKVLAFTSSNGTSFGCGIQTAPVYTASAGTTTTPSYGATNIADAIACLICKGFKVDAATEGTVILTRKRCHD